MHNEIVDRLSALRERMKSEGVEWYMITGTDAHLSEYVAPHWRTREFISAFTGSAGTVLVSLTGAWLWTDSRYFIQAASQIEGTGIGLMRMGMEGVPEMEDFILSNAGVGDRIGICAQEVGIREFKRQEEVFAAGGLRLVATDDLLDDIWTDRPGLP